MANPTTYFGWVMPNSADLVTDLPADFAVFGQGVDTSMQYLLGGTTGQILSKTSGTNMAFTWINNDQGDITGVTAGTGISGGGTSGTVTVSIDTAVTADLTTAQTLTNKKLSDSTTTIVDATDATKAIKFDVAGTTAITGTIATAFTTAKTVTIPDTTGTVALTNGVINNTLTTTTGDIIYASAANTPARLGIGSSAQVLTVSGGVPTWATPAAGGGMTLINTGGTTLSGSSTTISSIPSTYKSLYILVENVRNTTSGSGANYRFNSDTGTKYVSREYYDTDAQPIQVATGVQMYNNFSNASPYGTVVIQIPNYTSTGYKLHTTISAADSHSNVGYSYFYQRNRAYFGSSAISSITFYTSDSFAGGTAYVYGVN